MAIIYHIYSNNGGGGPVDFSSPVASTATLTYTTGPLSRSTDWTFAVRSFDSVTNLEEANTGVSVRVAVGPDGSDATGLPGPPHALALSARSGGGCRVSWAFAPALGAGPPVGFRVYLSSGTSAGGPPPAATVGYSPGKLGYTADLPGPYPLSGYAVAVAAFNPAGEGPAAGPLRATFGAPPGPFAMEPVVATV